MGVRLATKNVDRRIRVSRSTSPRVVPGGELLAVAPSWTAASRGGRPSIARDAFPEIVQRRRYLAALDRIVTRIRLT